MERITRNGPALLVAAALTAAGVLTLALTWHLTFYADTWDYLINRRAITADTVFTPHNEHIVAIPVLIEQLFLRVFGMSSAKPEYVLLTILLLVTAYLVYAYVKRRLGPWPALFAAAALLFLGPAFEVLLWPFEICFIGSVLFGLAMLLALERSDRRGDIAACLFLIVSLGFSSLGVAFLCAGFVAVIQSPRAERLRRAYVFVVPGLLFAAWYLRWGHEAESHISLVNILASPRYVAEGVAFNVGSIFGLGASPYGPTASPNSAWGVALLVLLIAGLIFKQVRRPGFDPRLWPAAAAATAYWLLAAFNQFPGREPTASRYQYAGAVFLFLVVANLLQGVRISRRMILIGAGVTLLAIGPNVVILKNSKPPYEEQSVYARADTAALEIARRTVDPTFQLNPEVAGTPSLINIFAEEYLQAVDEYGSPAYSVAELEDAPEEGRRQADVVLSLALPLSTETLPGRYDAGGGKENCLELPGGSANPVEVPVSSGLTRIEVAPGPRAGLTLRRFAIGEYPVNSDGAPGNSTTLLRIPRDTVRKPWFLHVDAKQPARVCR